MNNNLSYVTEPVDRYETVYRVGFYKPTGEWIEAPHVEGWGDFGGFLRGPLRGYLKENALEYVNWLNGNSVTRTFSLN